MNFIIITKTKLFYNKIMIKLNLLDSEEDYNKLCFKSLIMYLQLGKKLRCSINKIIESIGYPI